MMFAALLLLSPLRLFGDVALPLSSSTSNVLAASAVAAPEIEASLTPAPALIFPAAVPAAPAEAAMPEPKPEAAPSALPQPRALAFEPVRPAARRSYETPNQKRLWYGLMAAGHAGAAFDAWTTRRALSGNWGTEADPMMRPFAHSNAIYVATQVGPTLMDFIGKRAMTSSRPWVRRLWWLPQSVGATMSFQAGIHNVGVVH
jgi:hypothetical protein